MNPGRCMSLYAGLSVLFIFVTAACACTASGGERRDASSAEQVHEIVSIDPADTDFSDLQVLGADIGTARIVMLGEQSHGTGSTFLAKTRVLKYLHEELGFNVLAFESGMYEMEQARALVAAGQAPSAVLPRAIFPVWMQSVQMQPFMDYLDAEAKGAQPMQLAGFDLNFTGALARDVPQALDALNAELDGDPAGLERVRDVLKGLFAGGGAALKALEIPALQADVAATIARLDASAAPRAPFWRQQLSSIETMLTFLKGITTQEQGAYNLRDRQMAANLSWLANVAYPEERIIVWAATSHIIKDRTVVETTVAPDMIPMGSYIHREFGRDAYVLAFSAYQGRTSSFARREVYDHDPAPADSIEARIAARGHEYAFVGRRGLQRLFGGQQVGLFLGFAPMKALWPQVIDGVLFIKDMQPSEFLTEKP